LPHNNQLLNQGNDFLITGMQIIELAGANLFARDSLRHRAFA
jgi:hypothetical protein